MNKVFETNIKKKKNDARENTHLCNWTSYCNITLVTPSLCDNIKLPSFLITSLQSGLVTLNWISSPHSLFNVVMGWNVFVQWALRSVLITHSRNHNSGGINYEDVTCQHHLPPTILWCMWHICFVSVLLKMSHISRKVQSFNFSRLFFHPTIFCVGF